MQASRDGSSSSPAGGVPLRFSAALPSRDDERSLEFLQQCELDPVVARLLLASRLGVGYDEDAMRLVATASSTGPRTRSGAATGSAAASGSESGSAASGRRSGRGLGSLAAAALASRAASNGSGTSSPGIGAAQASSASAAPPNETDEEMARLGVLLGPEATETQQAFAAPDRRGLGTGEQAGKGRGRGRGAGEGEGMLRSGAGADARASAPSMSEQTK